MRSSSYKALVGGGFCLIVFWPFATEKPSILIRCILLAFCGYAAAILSGNALAAQGTATANPHSGRLAHCRIVDRQVCNKVAPTNSKEPQCFRWSSAPPNAGGG